MKQERRTGASGRPIRPIMTENWQNQQQRSDGAECCFERDGEPEHLQSKHSRHTRLLSGFQGFHSRPEPQPLCVLISLGQAALDGYPPFQEIRPLTTAVYSLFNFTHTAHQVTFGNPPFTSRSTFSPHTARMVDIEYEPYQSGSLYQDYIGQSPLETLVNDTLSQNIAINNIIVNVVLRAISTNKIILHNNVNTII